MDKDQLIMQVVKEQGDKTSIQIKGVHKAMDAGFTAGSIQMKAIEDRLAEVEVAKKTQNGRVDKLEKVTVINKFVYNNPKASIFIALLGVYGAYNLLSVITVADMIKKYLPF